MIVLSTVLISTKSSASRVFPSARFEQRKACRTTIQKIFRRLTRKRILMRRDGRNGAGLGETLQDEARAVFRNIEAQLDIRALNFDVGRLRIEKQVGVGQLQQALRFIPDPRRQLIGGWQRFCLENQPGLY